MLWNRCFILLRAAAICLIVALTMSGCRDTKPLLVGFVGPLTGKYADLGIAGRDAVILAVEEVNGAGGINGRKIELLAKDDGQDPRQARQVDREMIDAGVVAIIGHMTSAMSMVGQPIANSSRVVMLSPTTSSDDLTGIDDYFIRVYPPSRDTARLLAAYAYNGLGRRSISVVYDAANEAHSLGWRTYFSESYRQMGGRLGRTFSFAGGNQGFPRLAREIAASGSDGVFIIAGAMDTALLSQHLRKAGFTMPIVVSEWSTTDELLKLGGAAVEGITFLQTFDRASTSPAYRRFSESYRERFHCEPAFASVHAYDSAKILFAALARNSDPAKLKQTILSLGNFDGLQSKIMLDRFGDPKRTPFLMTIKNGSFQRVK